MMNDQLNSEFEEVCEDLGILYDHFRKKELPPGPSTGRALYEMEDTLGGRPELEAIAFLRLSSLASKEKVVEHELVSYYVKRLSQLHVSPDRFLMSIYNQLENKNKLIFTQLLADIYHALEGSLAVPETSIPVLAASAVSFGLFSFLRKRAGAFPLTLGNIKTLPTNDDAYALAKSIVAINRT